MRIHREKEELVTGRLQNMMNNKEEIYDVCMQTAQHVGGEDALLLRLAIPKITEYILSIYML